MADRMNAAPGGAARPMSILAVDDERAALQALERAVATVAGQSQFASFSSGKEALDYAQGHPVDVAFLDIEMPEISGLALAKRLKDIHRDVNIIFVTGYGSYMRNAFELRVSGYVLKPVDPEQVRAELENLRNPVGPRYSRAVQIRCFGNFEVFSHGAPLAFRFAKTKELLAYLVDRAGAACTMGELLGILYENKPDSASQRSQLRKLIADLRGRFEEAGAGDAILKGRDRIALLRDRVDCDYFDFLRCVPTAVNLYHQEYMNQYSWAEMTNAGLAPRGGPDTP